MVSISLRTSLVKQSLKTNISNFYLTLGPWLHHLSFSYLDPSEDIEHDDLAQHAVGMVLHHLGKFENKWILDKVQQMGNRLPAEILKTSVGDPNTLNLDPDPGLILREFV